MNRGEQRRPNATACHDEVVFIAHASDSLHNLAFVVGDDLDAFELDAEREAEAREEVRVCVFGLESVSLILAFDQVWYIPFHLAPHRQ